MASDKTQTITDDNFESTIKNATVPVMVDFWAEWCQPCVRLGPTIDGLAVEFDGKLVVGKINVDENPSTPSRFGVRSIPMVMLFKGGQLVDEFMGLASKADLKKMLAPHIAG
jgi:thioredoxin 1